ncbi:MAG TPA: DeoR/GlpR family DNA-binding transcription regulator [Pyrinomonadaceae bacterium]|jgi:DeoR family transcriptional regulator of aga operon|nr:DeoR/GlpR family DNA-binding transcription regulator [Pyrinomonadaceae bacterium]
MLKTERDKEILRQLLRDGEVTVERLTERFETSPATIRRELSDLEGAGLLRRTHGGAIQVEPLLYEPFRGLSSFGAQQQVQSAEKRRIGLAAAEMIKDGEFVALSAGTTTTQVGRSIHHRKKVTIMTNAINIAMELSHRVDLKIIMTGGVLNKNCFALTGPSGITALKEMFYDRAFISVDGIHPEYGLTSDTPELGAINRVIIQQSRKTVVVADHSKFGRVCQTLISPVAKVDLIITDNNAPRRLSGISTELMRV